MEVTALRQDLTKTIVTASRFISSRAQLPILSNIVIKADRTRLYVFSTNLEMSYASFVNAKITKEGEIAIPGRLFAELLPNISGEQITLSVVKESLTVSAEGFSSKIASLNTSDFPSIPHELTEKQIELPTKFLNALKKVIFSAGTDDARPVLTGVLFLFTKDQLTLVSSDGFRLSRYIIPVVSDLEEKMIIPRVALVEVLKGAATKTLFEKKEESQVLFGFDNTTLASRVIEGEFPNFERIIPKTSTTTLSLSKIDLEMALARAAVFARDDGNIVHFVVNSDSLLLSAQSQKTGTQESSIGAKVTGPETRVPFNYRFIDEFLKSVDGKNVTIRLTDGSAPGIFEDPDDPGFLHLIMPVRG